MKRVQKLVALLLVMCVVCSGCSGSGMEYESVQGFEFHMYPEEYEEEYREVSKTLSLETDTDYQLEMEAVCESGTMNIRIRYDDKNETSYLIHAAEPWKESLSIAASMSREVTVLVSIGANTKGTVMGELSAKYR